MLLSLIYTILIDIFFILVIYLVVNFLHKRAKKKHEEEEENGVGKEEDAKSIQVRERIMEE
jgi:regulatory protein YycI of two-component signal transduction system YycFG